jgi:hypothetical protein
MYEQAKTLKEGGKVMKPIYNHVTGLFECAPACSALRARHAVPRAAAPDGARATAQPG